MAVLSTSAACAQITHDGILVDAPDHSTVSSTQVDAAWGAAKDLAGSSHYQTGFVLTFTNGPYHYSGSDYDGLCDAPDAVVHVAYFDACIAGPRTALVHELLHEALYQAHGDMDSNHTAASWKSVQGKALGLQAQYCP